MGTELKKRKGVKVERQTSIEKLQMSPSEEESKWEKTVFWTAVIASQVVGTLCVALMGYWCCLNKGFSWNNDPNQQFYYHPFLMILGLVFFYGDAIIVYRVLSFMHKPTLKIIHAGLHISAIVCSSVALAAVFENHRRTNKADLYSLHSWVGIGTFAFFCLQYVISFMAFLFPGLPMTWRAKIMPFHTFLGIGIFALACGTVQMGLTEKLIWTDGYSAGKTNSITNTGNAIGILVIIFAFLIVFITTHSKYKRKPLPNEMPHTTVN